MFGKIRGISSRLFGARQLMDSNRRRLMITEGLESRTLWSASPSLTWNTAAPDPLPRAEGASFVADGQLFCFGGFSSASTLEISNEMDAYNPSTNTWTRMADCPVTVNDSPVTLDPTTDIAYTGGFFLINNVTKVQTTSSLVYAYHVKTNVWTQMPSLPQSIGAGQMGVVGSELYYFGGRNNANAGSVLMWKLNLSDPTAKWVSDTPMPHTANHDAAVVLDNKIYAIGGIVNREETSGNQVYVQVFNPETDKWTLAASLPFGIGHIASAATVANGDIIVAGGELNASTQTFSKAVLQYNPTLNKWTSLTNLPDYRASPFVGYTNGELIVTGGNMYSEPYIATNTWTATYNPNGNPQLTGKTIGTAGSYKNDGNTIAKATDGYFGTFFDGPTADGNWVGLDLGSVKLISEFSVVPRAGFASRMIGGKIQVSTSSNFTSGVTTIYTISTAPASGVFTTITLKIPVSARYIRYLSPNGSYGDISDFRVFG